jgi:hypothetical protein
MVGMFSSCYSYGQFINKITMLRKGGKEVKEIVRKGVGPRKVLLGRGLGITLTPDPSPKGRGGRTGRVSGYVTLNGAKT